MPPSSNENTGSSSTNTHLPEEPKPSGEQGLSLYVHIPFCETKCPYCDFNTYAGIGMLIPDYLKALKQEVIFWSSALEHKRVNTLFFGGGTPSLLSLSDLENLMECINTSFEISGDAEITLEANPGDLTLEKLKGYSPLGINRLSIGVQSLDDPLLKVLGRRHTAADAIAAYQRARDAGLNNISLDFIYGVSHQTLSTWIRTIEQAISLAPDHLSLYGLTIEPNTPMEEWVNQGILPEPDPDIAADMFLGASALLTQAEYQHYEISNWAKSDRHSRHNTTYWRNFPYLGIGPGAHSYLWTENLLKADVTPLPGHQKRVRKTPSTQTESSPMVLSKQPAEHHILDVKQERNPLTGYRFSVLRSPREYIRLAKQLTFPPATPPGSRVSQNTQTVSNSLNVSEINLKNSDPLDQSRLEKLPSRQQELGSTKGQAEERGPDLWPNFPPILDMIESIDRDLEIKETMITGLRLAGGISKRDFLNRFGVSLTERYGSTIGELQELGLLQWENDRLTLTDEGLLLGNEVFERFLME